MRALSASKKSGVQSASSEVDSIVAADDLAQLRHRVINDYQAVIACIFDEGVRSPSPEVKKALSRVADCVHELASSLRDSADHGEPMAPASNFDASKIGRRPVAPSPAFDHNGN